MLIWIDVVQDLISTYDGAYHHIFMMAPSTINKNNEIKLWTRLYRHIDRVVQKLEIPFIFPKSRKPLQGNFCS